MLLLVTVVMEQEKVDALIRYDSDDDGGSHTDDDSGSDTDDDNGSDTGGDAGNDTDDDGGDDSGPPLDRFSLCVSAKELKTKLIHFSNQIYETTRTKRSAIRSEDPAPAAVHLPIGSAQIIEPVCERPKDWRTLTANNRGISLDGCRSHNCNHQ
ncbi:hypothetical protein ElyMa_000088000 [Elysia marginata]|uniref:Uncharacterized protein n=1 Tax=Elysia marginata TaxID=1093978 RepID=A0AAV4EJH8_9GAST|nr:hypothetical protein ElyMa_000088000 [Elysia marginata]